MTNGACLFIILKLTKENYTFICSCGCHIGAEVTGIFNTFSGSKQEDRED